MIEELKPAATVWLTQKQIDVLNKAASTWGCDLELFVNHFLQLKMSGEGRDMRVVETIIRAMYDQANGVI